MEYFNVILPITTIVVTILIITVLLLTYFAIKEYKQYKKDVLFWLNSWDEADKFSSAFAKQMWIEGETPRKTAALMRIEQ